MTFSIPVGAVGLTVWIIAGSWTFEHCVQEKQNHSPADDLHYNIPEISVGIYRDCTGRFIHENRDDVIASFTILLAFSTIFLWIATRDLANQASISSRRQLRAYIAVNHPKFGRPDPDGLTITIENGGQTPAHNVTAWLNQHWILGADSLLPDGFKFEDKEQTGSVNVVYRSAAVLFPRKDAPFYFPIEQNYLERVRRREIVLFFYGHVDYVDIFGEKQTTRYCYQYSPTDLGIGHSLVMYDDHNDAT